MPRVNANSSSSIQSTEQRVDGITICPSSLTPVGAPVGHLEYVLPTKISQLEKLVGEAYGLVKRKFDSLYEHIGDKAVRFLNSNEDAFRFIYLKVAAMVVKASYRKDFDISMEDTFSIISLVEEAPTPCYETSHSTLAEECKGELLGKIQDRELEPLEAWEKQWNKQKFKMVARFVAASIGGLAQKLKGTMPSCYNESKWLDEINTKRRGKVMLVYGDDGLYTLPTNDMSKSISNLMGEFHHLMATLNVISFVMMVSLGKFIKCESVDDVHKTLLGYDLYTRQYWANWYVSYDMERACRCYLETFLRNTKSEEWIVKAKEVYARTKSFVDGVVASKVFIDEKRNYRTGVEAGDFKFQTRTRYGERKKPSQIHITEANNTSEALKAHQEILSLLFTDGGDKPFTSSFNLDREKTGLTLNIPNPVSATSDIVPIIKEVEIDFEKDEDGNFVMVSSGSATLGVSF